jgi:methyl-accepting chemotaxis protein
LPRSLWAQTLLLLLPALAVTWLGVAWFYSTKLDEQFDQELDKRGRAMVQTLENHTNLRLAIGNSDSAQATPILKGISDGDEDVRYVAALSPTHGVIGWAPASLSLAEVQAQVGRHFDAQAGSRRGEIQRFTQTVARKKSAVAAELNFDVPDAAKPEGADDGPLGYLVLGLSASRTKQRVLLQTLASVGLTALVVFILIVIYFRWVARRLGRMVSFAQEVAGGELGRTLDEPNDDELGRLADALRVMTQRNRNVVGQLVDASRSLNAAAGELFDSSQRQASNASRQAASVTEMGATVAQLREIFSQATSKAESVIDLARRSEESSTGGAQAVRESIDGIGQLRAQVAQIAQTIAGLVQRTEQIDAIIDVVTDLAEQSNVLAINAGIEAARAGEHGRGFAVVAREVSRLADRSKESTSQVRTILQDIKLAGREAVRVIDEGNRRAESSVQVANAAGEAIRRLGDAIATSSGAATQIASSTRQQSDGIDQIWQATKELDRIARETANGIHQLESAAGNMKSLSGSLGEIVGRYRI